MEYTLLGRTGITVSRLCFGTMSFGSDADETTSAAMFARCLDAGINFFDTANSYTSGRAEEILGRLLAREGTHGWRCGGVFCGFHARRNL